MIVHAVPACGCRAPARARRRRTGPGSGPRSRRSGPRPGGRRRPRSRTPGTTGGQVARRSDPAGLSAVCGAFSRSRSAPRRGAPRRRPGGPCRRDPNLASRRDQHDGSSLSGRFVIAKSRSPSLDGEGAGHVGVEVAPERVRAGRRDVEVVVILATPGIGWPSKIGLPPGSVRCRGRRCGTGRVVVDELD